MPKKILRISKGIFRSRMKYRQWSKNTIQKTKDRSTQIPLKTGSELNYAVPAPLVTPIVW